MSDKFVAYVDEGQDYIDHSAFGATPNIALDNFIKNKLFKWCEEVEKDDNERMEYFDIDPETGWNCIEIHVSTFLKEGEEGYDGVDQEWVIKELVTTYQVKVELEAPQQSFLKKVKEFLKGITK